MWDREPLAETSQITCVLVPEQAQERDDEHGVVLCDHRGEPGRRGVRLLGWHPQQTAELESLAQTVAVCMPFVTTDNRDDRVMKQCTDLRDRISICSVAPPFSGADDKWNPTERPGEETQRDVVGVGQGCCSGIPISGRIDRLFHCPLGTALNGPFPTAPELAQRNHEKHKQLQLMGLGSIGDHGAKVNVIGSNPITIG
jgi:hypothetical protein